MKYSLVIPVYNRPNEVEELLESLTKQRFDDFEVVIVEDGSKEKSDAVCQRYADRLKISYYYKDNSGPGMSRNYGVERAQGDYVIVLDSDVVVPEGYFEAVERHMAETPVDVFGGPDRAHADFSNLQKAINYSMTSFFTTGGIRGSKKKLDKFYPRSFNMGIRREVYNRLGGFSKMRFGEDIDFSIRLYKEGCKVGLFTEAWVWHKRRTDLKKFFRQVSNSGVARINLYKKYPESLKLVHLLPAAFTVGLAVCLLGALVLGLAGISWWHVCLWPIGLFVVLIFVDSLLKNKNLSVAVQSIMASFVQLVGYGWGFIHAWWKRCVLGQDEFGMFKKNFYK